MAGFRWSVRVYYEDTDAAGVVYHANYLKFLDQARTEWLRTAGYSHHALREEERLIFVVKDIHLQFKQAARLDDVLDITTQIKKAGAASILFAQEIFRQAQLLCRAEVNIACLGAESLKPRRIPKSLKEKFHYAN